MVYKSVLYSQTGVYTDESTMHKASF